MIVLHVGCGGAPLPDWIKASREVRFDIDPRHRPDVVGNMESLDGCDDDSFDMVYSSHSLEHLPLPGVRRALASMRRVLVPGGLVVVIVPDLDGIRPTLDVIYQSDAGPITGMDMIYGHHKLSENNPHMKHQCGFVRETLEAEMAAAGFHDAVASGSRESFNLVGLARK